MFQINLFIHSGIHQWEARKFTEIIPVGEIKVCPRFKKERFEVLFECPHISDETIPDSRHDLSSPASKQYQMILARASKAAFMNDLDKMKIENMTSYVENFHSTCIHYRPKRKYFPPLGFSRRTMLAVLAYNANRTAEAAGERRISTVYQSFSKSKGEMVTKYKKSPANEEWKKEIVDSSVRRKQEHGPGIPADLEPEEDEEDLEIVINNFDALLNFDDSDVDMDE